MVKRIKAAWIAFCRPDLLEVNDFLTGPGVLSKRNFFFLAKRELARAQHGQQLSLVFMDLDNLYEVNDTRGHDAGDLYLKKFAQSVLSNIRQYDLLTRWGGDEFILLLPGAGKGEAGKVINRIQEIFPRFSWGISVWSEGENLDSLRKKADQEMYRQKKSKNLGRIKK